MRTLSFVATLTCIAAACSRDSSPPADSAAAAASTAADTLAAGEARLAVDGGRIWYKVSGSGTATPTILLHGGPGFASFYMKSQEAISADRPVVRYDQLGAGHSDHITDTAMFNIAHFVRELDSLRSHLGYDKVHVIGHSWRTILGLEYYRAHPEHVASLTPMSPALDMSAWERNAKRLVKTLSDMQGPSEFTIVGTLKTYDATPFLKDVKVPVLLTVGEFDEADPPTVRKHAQMTPGAKVAVIPGAAHIVQWDAPDETNRVVRTFLQSVDSTRSKP